jgi:Tol biopolymer transport system component
MKPSRTILSLFFAVAVCGACGEASPPTKTVTSPPNATEIPLTIVPITVTSELTVSPTSSPISTLPSAVLPICQVSDVIELGGLTLAFVANWDGDWEIYTIQADGTGLVQVTDNATSETNPKWSPDGNQLAFVNDFTQMPRLMIYNADGSSSSIIAPDLEVTSDVVWSPVGDTIIFRSVDDLYGVNVNSGAFVNLTLGASFAPGLPSFSPDGARMVIEVNMLEGTPRHRLFTLKVDGTDLTELSFPDGDAYTPSWHPSKNEVLFKGVVLGEGVDLYLASLDGVIQDLAVNPDYRATQPTWSPNGTMIAYIVPDTIRKDEGPSLGKHMLRVLTENGTNDIPILLPPEGEDDELVIAGYTWGPDSRHIAYTDRILVVGGSNIINLYILDICDGISTLIVEDIADLVTPSWRPLP